MAENSQIFDLGMNWIQVFEQAFATDSEVDFVARCDNNSAEVEKS